MKKNYSLGRVSLLAATLIWGTSFVIMKNTLDSVNTLYILAFRFTIAALLMAAFAAKFVDKTIVKKIDRGYILGGAAMGLCLIAAYILQTYGLVYTTPGKNAFLTSSYCILTPFLIWLINRKRPAIKHFFAAFVCIIGIGFISLENDLTVNLGDLLTLACGIFYALHIIVIDKCAGGKNAAVLTAIQFAVAAVVAWIAAIIFAPFPRNMPFMASVNIVYMSVMCTAVCFFLQTFGQQNTPPSQASILMTLESVFGTIISVVFYNETLTVKLVLGFALMFAAVILSEVDFKELRRKK